MGFRNERGKRQDEIRIFSPLPEPAGDAHAGLDGGEDFVPEVSGEKADERSHARFDEFEEAVFSLGSCPEFEFAAVTRFPRFVEIEDHRDDPIVCSCVAVEVSFVKSTGRIDREVSFEIEKAEEKPLVEGKAKRFELSEIDFLFYRFFARLQPHHMVATDVFADFQTGSAADACTAEVSFFKGGLAFVFQPQGISGIETTGQNGPAVPVHGV